MHVPPQHYMTVLRSQLSRRLADLAGTLPMAKASDFEYFKKLARERFSLTSEHYRKAFRKVDKGLW